MIGDRYQAYVVNEIVGTDPLQLVVALYEAAIRRSREARMCLEAGDVWGRARAISKAGNILTELILSLDPNVGPEIGRNLDRLYRYMLGRLQEAHSQKKGEPLAEVERILQNLLEGWRDTARAEGRRTVLQPESSSNDASASSANSGYFAYANEPDYMRFASQVA